MALPVKQRTWTISGNNRITFVSLAATTQAYLFGIKTFLKAHGYTVRGSASAGVGAMDGVDRWTATTDVTPRATIAGASQAWMVLRDAAGVDLLLSWMGATDDIFLQAVCADGTGFVVNATPQFQPASANQQTISTATSMIGATTSGDRVWWGWVDSTSKMCRFAVAHGGTWVGRLWGVEEVASAVVAPCTVPIPAWGFNTPANTGVLFTTNPAGFMRTLVSSAQKLCSCVYGAEFFGSSTFCDHIKAPAQGGLGYLMYGLSIATSTTGGEGKLGNLIDWWAMQATVATGLPGDVMGSLEFIHMGASRGGAGAFWWPLDGVTTPQMT